MNDHARAHLKGLTDAELVNESADAIRHYRGFPRDSKERERAMTAANIPWNECADRGKLELWSQALKIIRQEEAEKNRVNQLPFSETKEP